MSDTRYQIRTALLHVLTPLHPGTGQTAAVIDLPVAREKATGYPIVPASSLKGVIRDALKAKFDEPTLERAFGSMERAGALCFGDQRLLCLPVRSYYGTFALVTCPLALARWKRDSQAMGQSMAFLDDLPVPETDLTVCSEAHVVERNGTYYLEDLDLKKSAHSAANAKAKSIGEQIAALLYPNDTLKKDKYEDRTPFAERFLIVSDAVFGFLSETATEVVTRIKLNAKGTTTGDGGNMWYEEAIPAEAVFCGPVLLEPRFQDAAACYDLLPPEMLIQIGGNASVGRGLCRLIVAGGDTR